MHAVVTYLRAHRKAVFVLAILLLAVVLIPVYLAKRKQEITRQGNFAIADPAARQEQLKKLQQDSDSDGLRDWEEALYHSDTQKSDTDGDGTLDGEEVLLGRDPVLAGPGDFMATSTPLENADSGGGKNLTRQLAEKIAKEMIVRRIANPDTPFDTNLTAQELVDTVLGSTPGEIQYSQTEKDMVIGRDNSQAAIKAYREAMPRIIEANSQASAAKHDVEVFTEAMQEQDYEKLKSLDPYLAEYDRLIVQLKKLPVPPKLAALHLEYLNLTVAQTGTVRKMRAAESDPINALIGLKQYVTVQERFKTLLEKFLNEFQKAGV